MPRNVEVGEDAWWNQPGKPLAVQIFEMHSLKLLNVRQLHFNWSGKQLEGFPGRFSWKVFLLFSLKRYVCHTMWRSYVDQIRYAQPYYTDSNGILQDCTMIQERDRRSCYHWTKSIGLTIFGESLCSLSRILTRIRSYPKSIKKRYIILN